MSPGGLREIIGAWHPPLIWRIKKRVLPTPPIWTGPIWGKVRETIDRLRSPS